MPRQESTYDMTCRTVSPFHICVTWPFVTSQFLVIPWMLNEAWASIITSMHHSVKVSLTTV